MSNGPNIPLSTIVLKFRKDEHIAGWRIFLEVCIVLI